MSSSASKRMGWLGPVLFAVVALAGCAEPDLYLDRRETISLHAGDAIAANIAVQTIDPWPRVAGNRDIPGNGDRMAAAGARYRTGKVTPPKGLGTSSVEFEEKSGSDSGTGAAK
jgi:hypothetical protein